MLPAVDANLAWTAFAAPVSVQTCRMDMAREHGLAPPGPLAAGLNLAFMNNAKQTATDVVFRVKYGYQVKTIDDRGKFSPGIAIDATFYDFQGGLYLSLPPTCEVLAVTFADGSSWRPKPTIR